MRLAHPVPGTVLARYICIAIVAAFCSGHLVAQTDANNSSTAKPSSSVTPVLTPAPSSIPTSAAAPANPWEFNLSVSGNYLPNGQSYASPTLTADRDTLHLEARYNYEGLQTGSLWVGYNLSVGKKLTLDVTPMIGGVFGRFCGIAPGVELTATYKKLQIFSANEYVFDTNSKAGNFFYTWTQLTYTPVRWFTLGFVTQRSRAIQTSVDVQRGPMVQFNWKKTTFSTQAFNIGETDPVLVFSLGYTF